MLKILKQIDWLELGIIVLLSAVLIYFWDSVFLYPFKIMMVVFHEVSHGLAAILTGGELNRIELSPDQSGLAYTTGGWRFFIASAGYVGSVLIGCIILTLSSNSKNHNRLISVFGILMILLGIIFVRPIIGFGIAFTIGVGIIFLLCGRFLPPIINRYFVKITGLVSVLYIIPHTRSQVLQQSIPPDAETLANLTGIPAIVWVTVWAIISVIFAIIFIPIAFRKEEKPAVFEF